LLQRKKEATTEKQVKKKVAPSPAADKKTAKTDVKKAKTPVKEKKQGTRSSARLNS
jgi:hypothetical protein